MKKLKINKRFNEEISKGFKELINNYKNEQLKK